MVRPDFYDEVYEYAKTYITEHSIFSPKVLKNSPTESEYFPLVIVKMPEVYLDDETLKVGGEQIYSFVLTIEIYAMPKTIENKKYSAASVSQELLKRVYEVFEEHYVMLGRLPETIPNADTNVTRISVRFTGRYKNNTFYRR